MNRIEVKRIYDPPEPIDGTRILVDRLWPRGVSKESAQLSLWMKEVAPSPILRKWFGHDPDKFEQFSVRYAEELSAAAVRPFLEQMIELLRSNNVTLLYAAKDKQCNHALVLQQYLRSMIASQGEAPV